MKKTILFALAAILLALTLLLTAGCQKNGNDEITTVETEDVTTEEPAAPSTVLMEGGVAKVKIVRSDDLDAGDLQITLARNILNALGEFGDVNGALVTDWTKDGTHDDNALEILVGSTNYKQTAEVAAELGYNAYAVRLVGNKIVVFGYSDDCLSAAVRDFVRQIRRSGDKETHRVELKNEDISFSGSASMMLSGIPHYDGGTLPILYDPGDDCEELIVPGTDVNGFNAYVAKMKAAGFEEKASNSIGDNSFSTLTNGELTVNAGYYNYEKSVRIIVEEYDEEDLKALGDGKGEKVTTAQISMLGLAYTDSTGAEKSNGLSIVMRLEDGRFIVVDGGFNRVKQSSLLIDTIKKQSADYRDKTGMKIAMWITTHAHGDHMGMISNQYSAIKNSGIVVENFVVNFMSDTERERAINYHLSTGSSHWSANEGSAWTKVYSAADYLGSNIVVAHVGQVWRFLGLDVDVLYTIESHGPKMATALNTTSLIMKFTFTDTATGKQTTYLSTGDATGDGFDITSRAFGSYLKCDMLQMAHHGGTTWGNDSGTIKAYKLVSPATLVWPCGDAYWPTSAAKSYNVGVQNVNTNPNYKETYVAGIEGAVTVFPLPYTVGTGVKTLP